MKIRSSAPEADTTPGTGVKWKLGNCLEGRVMLRALDSQTWQLERLLGV